MALQDSYWEKGRLKSWERRKISAKNGLQLILKDQRSFFFSSPLLSHSFDKYWSAGDVQLCCFLFCLCLSSGHTNTTSFKHDEATPWASAGNGSIFSHSVLAQWSKNCQGSLFCLFGKNSSQLFTHPFSEPPESLTGLLEQTHYTIGQRQGTPWAGRQSIAWPRC